MSAQSPSDSGSRERYVLPLREASRFVRYPEAHCSECGQAVVDGENDDATLVCVDCLLRDSKVTGRPGQGE